MFLINHRYELCTPINCSQPLYYLWCVCAVGGWGNLGWFFFLFKKKKILPKNILMFQYHSFSKYILCPKVICEERKIMFLDKTNPLPSHDKK